MNSVISEEQARKITGGRKPLVPVEYEAAVKALQACVTLDEAKYWGDKADALAAWAKIYKSDEAGNEARRLKLHAYRRMGQIAAELRPGGRREMKPGKAGVAGNLPGPLSLLQEYGLRRGSAVAARKLAILPKEEFIQAVSQQRPPTPEMIVCKPSADMSQAWKVISGRGDTGHANAPSLASFANFCKKNKAKQLARGLHHDEIERARAAAVIASEWLDAFEQALPKT